MGEFISNIDPAVLATCDDIDDEGPGGVSRQQAADRTGPLLLILVPKLQRIIPLSPRIQIIELLDKIGKFLKLSTPYDLKNLSYPSSSIMINN